MALDTITRTVKAFYEEIHNSITGGKRGIDEFLFGTLDSSVDSANFTLDELVYTPYGISFRKPGEQSHLRPYVNGTGQVFEVPRAAVKTPISEDLRDAIIVGGEFNESFSSRNARMLGHIIRDHTVGHNTTRWYNALNVIRTGKYNPLGIGGGDIGLEIDFGRDASLDITYDFTAAGATVDKALTAALTAYRAQHGSRSNVICLMGSKWLKEFEEDTTVQDKREANTANILLEQNMMPAELQNTYGLYVAGRYRVPGVLFPVWICGFETEAGFIAYKGATETDFMPEDEMLIFSMDSTRYKVQRMITAYNDAKQEINVTGDIVFDSYKQDDPITTLLRSQTRHAFIPANVNHTLRSTGTFDES